MSENLTYDVWLPLSDRVDDGGLDDLTVDEQTVYLCYDFICQFGNGGLSGYGYNVDAAERSGLVAALRRIGALQCADLMHRANYILNTPVSPNDAKTWEQFLQIADPNNELDQIHDSLTDQIESDGLRDSVDELAAVLANGQS